jgi:RNA polymerase sigma-70 factor (ECF subfamily)
MEELSMSDADLVCLGRAGEAEALAYLLERYRPSLYAAAIGVLHNRDDALEAVQETCITALVRIGSLRDAAAVGGWLHAIVRNACLMRLRRSGREVAYDPIDLPSGTGVPVPEDVLDQVAAREWVWATLEALGPDDRATMMLRYFSRCCSYEQIAAVTGAPLGTVRSRLHRSRTALSRMLGHAAVRTGFSHAELEQARRDEWEHFYAELHESPIPRTYRATYTPDVEVSDSVGRWNGVREWADHEREAITLGVRARIVGLVASRDLTIIEIDFANPEWAGDHSPPRSTFVHHLADGRSRRLAIHYV